MAGIFAEFLSLRLDEEEAQIREILKDYFDESVIDTVAASVKDYLLGIPVSLRFFASLVLDPTTPQEVRTYFSLVAAYLINPENFSPESKEGILGLIDDAYLLHSSLEIVIKTLDENKLRQYSQKMEILEPLFKFNSIVRSKLSEVKIKKLDVIINYLEKLLEVKAVARERPVYVLPPV